MEYDKELVRIYESTLIEEGLVNSLGKILTNGIRQGMGLFDIVANNLPEFIAAIGLLSSTASMQKIHTMYQEHPEILKKHTEYYDQVVHDIGQFFIEHPEILKKVLSKGN